MIIIGSRALKYWYPDFERQPKDYDVLGTYQELCDYVHQNYGIIKSSQPSRDGKYLIRFNSGHSVEFEYTQRKEDSQNALLTLEKRGAPKISFPERGLTVSVAFPFALLALKKSHLSVPLKQWEKHILDYHFLKSQLAKESPSPFFDTIYERRLQETKERGVISTAKLCMTNEEFFDKSEPSVKRYYTHDDVHKAIAFYGEPMFTKIKRDPKQATCDKVLFMALSYEDQLKAVLEEAFIIALERKIIPSMMTLLDPNHIFSGREALKYALQRICTNLTSGWFREFAQEHYLELLNTDVDYVTKFKEAQKDGRLLLQVNV
jgi:hypothetical protein